MARGVGRPVAALVLSDEERSYLERQVRRRQIARALSDRCRMILRCADGLTSKAVAAEFGVHEHTVGKWRRRFLKDRIDGLSDEPRAGRPRTIEDDRYGKAKVSEIREFSNPFGPEKRPGFPGHLQRLFTKFAKTLARLYWVYPVDCAAGSRLTARLADVGYGPLDATVQVAPGDRPERVRTSE